MENYPRNSYKKEFQFGFMMKSESNLSLFILLSHTQSHLHTQMQVHACINMHSPFVKLTLISFWAGLTTADAPQRGGNKPKQSPEARTEQHTLST